ncbi:hypothetical protein SALBM311S_09822 [Streptomyces alboniger]
MTGTYGASDAQPAWYTAERAGAAVRMLLAADSASILADHCAPYIGVVAGDRAPEDAWIIRSIGDDATGEGDLIDQPGKGGDIGYRLWIDGANRVLSTSKENALTQQRRLVRCLLRRTLMDRGYSFLHSALVVSRHSGRALALAGSKRSGKTSLTLATLISGDFHFATNDDLTVNLDTESQPDAFGWPRAVGIRRDTLRLLAGKGTRLRQVLQSRRHPAQVRQGNPMDHRAVLFPDELVQATGASIAPQAPLSAIVVPRFDSSALTPTLEKISDRDEAYQLILPCVEDRASREEGWLDQHYKQPSGHELSDQAARLSKRVPVFRLTQSMACLAESAKLLHELAVKETL